MKASILAWMQQHGYGVASNYNSQEAVRATVRATLMKGLDGFDETGGGVGSVFVPRSSS